MKISSCVASEIGTKKKVNQDAVMLKVAETPSGENVVLAVLCDGLGGLSHGEEASSIFVAAMETWFTTTFQSIFSENGGTEALNHLDYRTDYRKDVRISWEHLVQDMNKKIALYGQSRGFALGTTAVCFLMIGDDYLLMHVGDSRLYMMTDLPGEIIQLTHDHSLVQRQIDHGTITGNEAGASKYQSVLLQCIGASPDVHPDYYFGNVTHTSNFLLCTDGFWRKLSLDEIEETYSPQVCNNETEAERRIYHMINEVMIRGEEDNISAILVCCNMQDEK